MKRFTQEIAKATRGILDVAARVADHDPSRPEYHFHAPAQWMDDPNGIIYHKGYYHMMYSLIPMSSMFFFRFWTTAQPQIPRAERSALPARSS